MLVILLFYTHSHSHIHSVCTGQQIALKLNTIGFESYNVYGKAYYEYNTYYVYMFIHWPSIDFTDYKWH